MELERAQHKKEAMSEYSILSYPAKDTPKTYLPLIYSSWLYSLRCGNPSYAKLDKNEYFTKYHLFIENLMDKPDSVVRLAVLSDDHDVVLGWSVSREDVLDYVRVQKDYRRMGIAKKLMPPKLTAFSHVTITALKIWQRTPKYRYLEFNPHA